MFLALRRARFKPEIAPPPTVMQIDPAAFTLGWNEGYAIYWNTSDQFLDLAARSEWQVDSGG